MIHEDGRSFYISAGIRYPAEDLFGYPDSLIKARLDAAYRFGCELIPGRKRERTLDIGSGHGHGVVTINRMLSAGNTISSDANFSFIEAQHSVLSDGTDSYSFLQLKAPGLPIKTSSVDTIFLMHAIEHLKKPGETLKEIRRVLKPDGELVVATPWKNNLVAKNPADERVYSEDELKEAIENAGFKTEIFFITPDSAASKVHERKKKLARVPFARKLRRVIPTQLTEKVLRSGVSSQALASENFHIDNEASAAAIDLLAVAKCAQERSTN